MLYDLIDRYQCFEGTCSLNLNVKIQLFLREYGGKMFA
jgi:hypothetical protein